MSRIFITWVSSWIGKELLNSYIKWGHSVFGVVRTKKQKELLSLSHPSANIIISDLSNTHSLKKLSSKIEKEKYDVIIFNAGYGTYKHFWEIKEEEIFSQIMVNLYSPLLILWKNIKNVMLNNTKIVFISSISYSLSLKNLSIYIASKWWLSNFYRVFQKEYPNISSLCLEIGATKTPMHVKSGMKKTVWKDLGKVTKKIIKTIKKKQWIQKLYLDWWIISKISRILQAIFS